MENKISNQLDSQQDHSINNKLIVYRDKYITINNDELTINCYYFPLPLKKTIKIKRIKKIDLINLNTFTGKLKVWGMNYKMHWFHLDANRVFKSQCILLDLGTCIKPAITPDNILQVYEILCEKLVKS